MLFNCNLLADNLKQGVLTLRQIGFLSVGENGTVIKATSGNQIIIDKREQEIIITYDTVPHFYMALARSMGMEKGIQEITPKIKQFGVMLDCSRNAVAKPDMIKRLISLLVMSGYTYLELYTEDTYELPNEPYFGYKRGRYSREELSEIVSFARVFEFEIIPCIQTLAHLKHLNNWGVYFEHMDIDDILLVGDERTYALISKCIKFCKEVFRTKRINIGTDEAFHLGRGKYVDRYGYKSKQELYLEHLKRVFQICRNEGLEPEFWADAFYNMESSVDEIRSVFDGSQMPIYWNYDVLAKENHVSILQRLKEYAGQVMYAGGFWKWIGFAPDNAYSERAMESAFEAAIECNVENILMTAWGDNGDECSVYAVTPAMWYAAQKVYPCDVDMNRVVCALTGYSIEEWKKCDKLNRVVPNIDKISSVAKDFLYNDFLIGLLDFHVPEYAGEVYRGLCEEFRVLSQRDSQFAYIFVLYSELCNVLTRKATYGKRLYESYHKNERIAMKKMIGELSHLKTDIQNFYQAFRRLWLKENKGYGFEVNDVRIGGLLGRIDTVILMLSEYVDGYVEKIYELEDDRLDFWNGMLKGDEIYAPHHNEWLSVYTVNNI